MGPRQSSCSSGRGESENFSDNWLMFRECERRSIDWGAEMKLNLYLSYCLATNKCICRNLSACFNTLRCKIIGGVVLVWREVRGRGKEQVGLGKEWS